MKYMCLIYEPVDTHHSAEEHQKIYADYGAYTKAAHDSGRMVDGNQLQPKSAATTVRVRDGKRVVTDGPFAETKEWLTGYYTFECDDLDGALDWASKIPGAKYGSIEVRPLVEM